MSTQISVNDVGSAAEFLAAIEGTIKNFNDGDLVSGIVVQVDRDEVLLDIGYKTEGVIPSRELSIRNDLDPSELVKVGERIEALVLQKEDKEGRLILSKKRAQYEKAWGEIEGKKERDVSLRASCGSKIGSEAHGGKDHQCVCKDGGKFYKRAGIET